MTWKIGSLFSGIGGLELGFERTGRFETVWQVEINPDCRRVLERHWPHARRHEDVKKVEWGSVERVDGLVAGPPCQPTSQAGQRRGESDERWLWPEFLGAVRVLRPRFVVAENPPDLLTLDGGRSFGRILGALASCGYESEWQIVSAEALGAWHQRERIFLVAYLDRDFQQPGRGQIQGANRRACHGIPPIAPHPDRQRQQQPAGVLGEIGRRAGNRDAEAADIAFPRLAERKNIATATRDVEISQPERNLVFNVPPSDCGFWQRNPAPAPLRGNGLSAEFAEWFMGFPAGWTDVGIGNGRRVKMLGNAVVPQVAEYVARQTADFLGGSE